MADLTDEEKRILEKLLKDRFGPRPANEKFETDIDPKKWDAPIGLDDEGNPYPVEGQPAPEPAPPTPEEEVRMLERLAARERELAQKEAEEAKEAKEAEDARAAEASKHKPPERD
jgi:hypothetical protein